MSSIAAAADETAVVDELVGALKLVAVVISVDTAEVAGAAVESACASAVSDVAAAKASAAAAGAGPSAQLASVPTSWAP